MEHLPYARVVKQYRPASEGLPAQVRPSASYLLSPSWTDHNFPWSQSTSGRLLPMQFPF